jgi:hypothetical protein
VIFGAIFGGYSLGEFEGVSSRFLLWVSRMSTWCLFSLVIFPPQICGKAFDFGVFRVLRVLEVDAQDFWLVTQVLFSKICISTFGSCLGNFGTGLCVELVTQDFQGHRSDRCRLSFTTSLVTNPVLHI